MSARHASAQSYALAFLAAATVGAALVRRYAASGATPAPSRAPVRMAPLPLVMPREAAAVVAAPARARRLPSIVYARSADLMAYALMMTGLALVFVGVVHENGFLVPVGLSWCAASLAVGQLRNTVGTLGAFGFGVAGLVGGGHAFVFGFRHFASVADFGPALFALIGSLAAVSFALTDLASTRTGLVRWWTAPAGVLFVAVTALAVAATGVSAAVTVSARERIGSEARSGAIDMAMRDVRFSPETLSAEAGKPMKLVVTNNDLIVHTFTMREAGVDEEIGAGSERLVKFTLTSPGTYTYVCTVPGHDLMTGTITVR